ncbi:MAG: PrsW family glutamic-type intramembrane protease [Candidatus Gracilibacteria bacterium]|nr:PrsW family glutamic-type intramembrane protease [Candidatus Gracilibacteria bacterium]
MPLSILVIILMAVAPALGWIAVYYYLDSRDPEPKVAILVSVILGMLSTMPIFAMQYIFETFPDFDLLSIIQGKVGSPFTFAVGFLVFVAVLEEFSKGVAFLCSERIHQKVFNQVVDGIVYAACVGLGFAIAENIYYFVRAMETFEWSSEFIAIFTIRSFGTMLAHSLFSGLFGFYFAKAYFAPFLEVDPKERPSFLRRFPKNVKKAIKLNATFFYLMPKDSRVDMEIERNATIIEGFIVAMFLHFVYNFLIKIELFGQHWTFLIVPLVFIMCWFVWSRFFAHMYIRIVDFVRVRRDVYRVKMH